MNREKQKNASGRSVSLRSHAKDIPQGKRKAVKIALLVLLVCFTVFCLYYCSVMTYTALKEANDAQCPIIDETEQVSIKATPHITEKTVRSLFGLKNGANLAKIDFKGKREEILRKYPIFKSITIKKQLPARVDITIEERKPIARINYKKSSNGWENWDVVDASGIVFKFNLNASRTLPLIKESSQSASNGQKLSGKSVMGLKFIKFCSSRDNLNFSLAGVDVSNKTYLIAYTRDYDTIKILWDFAEEKGDHDTTNIQNAIQMIRDICNNNLRIGYRQTFIVTGNGRVTVSPYEKEQSR